MKTGVLICVFLLLVGIAILVTGELTFYYPWQRDVQSYYDLAWDASTLKEKHDYLKTFLDALRTRGLDEGHAALIWKTPQNDMSNQYELLEALVERMEEALEMDKNSLEYQYIMRQIEENEIDYVNAGLFKYGLEIRTVWWWLTWVGWILVMICISSFVAINL